VLHDNSFVGGIVSSHVWLQSPHFGIICRHCPLCTTYLEIVTSPTFLEAVTGDVSSYRGFVTSLSDRTML